MTVPNCESWETGKPFTGIPSKFIIVNEDGENIGTLADLLPMLLYAANNLQDLENPGTARQNLGVYSETEVDDAIADATPDASEAVSGLIKLATSSEASSGTNDLVAVTPKKLHDNLKNAFSLTPVNVTSSRVNNTVYTNPSSTKWRVVSVSAIILAGGSFKFIVNGVSMREANSVAASWEDGGTFLIPPGGTYKTEGVFTLNLWGEI